MGPDGEPLPITSDAEILRFLATAQVVESKQLSDGINKPLKVRLRKDGIEAHAVFRTVDHKELRYQAGRTIHLNFHDSYIFECAAFTLSRLLGLDHVPPCALRTIDGKEGSIQLWIEEAMTETKRRERGLEPPVAALWVRQRQTLRLFDALISNFDRNQGNMLIDGDWKLWFIDHTRSFRSEPEVEGLERIVWCEKGVWERLRSLGDEEITAALEPFVDKRRLRHLLERRVVLVRHLETRIATHGEDAVLFRWDELKRIEDMEDYEVATAEDDDIAETTQVEEAVEAVPGSGG